MSRSADECVPLLAGFSRITTCYLPEHVSTAERLMPFAPVNPEPAVRRHTGLALRQVLACTGSGLLAASLEHPIEQIVYLFGAGMEGGIPFPAPPEPVFVVVAESLWRDGPGSFPQMDRAEGWAGGPGYSQPVVGPWSFHATIDGGRAQLTVTANLSYDAVLQLGEEIVSRAGSVSGDTP